MKHLNLAVAASAIWLFPCFAAATTLDYLNSATYLEYLGYPGAAINALGETFVADDTILQDASLGLATYDHTVRPRWKQPHLEVRRGGPDQFTDNSSLLFKSSQIDFGRLPIVGSFGGLEDVLGAKLSDWGYANPLTLVPGETYSLLITNDAPYSQSSTSDWALAYGGMYPREYLGGGMYYHDYIGNAVYDHTSSDNVAFNVVMTPEPLFGSAILFCLFIPRRVR